MDQKHLEIKSVWRSEAWGLLFSVGLVQAARASSEETRDVLLGEKLMDEPDDITCSVIDFVNCAGEWEAGWVPKLWGNWVIEVDMGGWRHYNRLNPAKFRLAAA